MKTKFDSKLKTILSAFVLGAFFVTADLTTTFAAPNDADPNMRKKPAEKFNYDPADYEKMSAMRYIVKDLEGVQFQTDGSFAPTFLSKNWKEPTNVGDRVTVRALKNGLVFERNMRDGKREFITASPGDNRAAMTVLEGPKVVSHTITGKWGTYTATQGLCEILKKQTKSDDFEKMSEKANACVAFYDRKITDANFPALIAVHRTNIASLRNSVAAPLIPDGGVALKAPDFWETLFSAKPKVKKATDSPRAILSKTSSDEEIADRHAIAELAEACARLFKPRGNGGDAEQAAAAPAAPAASSTIAK